MWSTAGCSLQPREGSERRERSNLDRTDNKHAQECRTALESTSVRSADLLHLGTCCCSVVVLSGSTRDRDDEIAPKPMGECSAMHACIPWGQQHGTLHACILLFFFPSLSFSLFPFPCSLPLLSHSFPSLHSCIAVSTLFRPSLSLPLSLSLCLPERTHAPFAFSRPPS